MSDKTSRITPVMALADLPPGATCWGMTNAYEIEPLTVAAHWSVWPGMVTMTNGRSWHVRALWPDRGAALSDTVKERADGQARIAAAAARKKEKTDA